VKEAGAAEVVLELDKDHLSSGTDNEVETERLDKGG
jgi:hypothetical protein